MSLAYEPYYTRAEPPATKSLSKLRRASKACEACHLWRHATQTVFGDGAAHAKLFFIGEQPGDKEDLAGKPFVGPAGTLLRRALAEAEIDEARVYVTNAVKHFKWVLKNKKRIHASPNRFELEACRPWLEVEIEAVDPEMIVCLGASAVASVLGSGIKVLANRGRFMPTRFGKPALITVHPSSILRSRDHEARHAARAEFVADLMLLHLH